MMASTDTSAKTYRRLPRRRRAGHRAFLLALAAVLALAAGTTALLAYILWPRWPSATVAPGAPALPITIAGVAFNVPPAAVRVRMQRRPGAHERVDLVFLWPSLDAPDPHAKPPIATPDAVIASTETLQRVFMTIAAAGDTIAPADRVVTIYPRYVASEATPGPAGLAVLAFRDGTPYQGEDLIYDESAPGFLVRCTRRGAGRTPGTCLYERRIDAADVIVRFPRDWLADWRAVAGNIERLIAGLRPPQV